MAQRVIAAGLELDAAVLEELLAAQRRAIEHLDSPAFLRADEQFHLYVLAASGNRRAVEAAQRTWLHVNRARYMVPMTVSHMRASLRGHRDIVAALAERSPSRVQRAIRAHLEEPLRRQLQHLAERNPEAFTEMPAAQRAQVLQAPLLDASPLSGRAAV
jgi:DNA-binding GntR family transcriptional regulator